MRVAHIVGSYREGLGYEENHLGFAQASLGTEVHLITALGDPHTWAGLQGPTKVMRDDEPGIYEDRGVTIHRLFPHLRLRNGSQIVLRGLKNTLKTIEPDILHIHSPVGILTIQALATAKSLDIPIVIDNHLCYHNMRPYGRLKRIYYYASGRTVLRYFDSVIHRYLPLTRDSEEVLHSELGVPREKMTHSTLGVDTESFAFNSHVRDAIRSQLGIPEDATVIAFVGRISPEKEVDVLVRAWSRLAIKHHTFLLLIGPLTREMESSLVELVDPSLRHMCHITGNVEYRSLPDYISAADIGAWPSSPGVSVIESMACHLAIIHSDEGAIGHLVANGNGRSFVRGDEHHLETVLDSIVSDRCEMNAMRQRSRSLAEEVFDWRVVAERTNSVYASVLKGREPSLPRLW